MLPISSSIFAGDLKSSGLLCVISREIKSNQTKHTAETYSYQQTQLLITLSQPRQSLQILYLYLYLSMGVLYKVYSHLSDKHENTLINFDFFLTLQAHFNSSCLLISFIFSTLHSSLRWLAASCLILSIWIFPRHFLF